ncbi:MAG TPA: lyase family protein [Acidimicrobiia bacterium]|nr:lyase family protein [Acidimicrobiia bacterium]
MPDGPSFDPGFSTDALTALYSPGPTVDALLRFEEALALALADTGLAPRDEAEATARACRVGVEDPQRILESTWETGTPIIALREAVGAGQWFHYGATTQDAVDTAQMIQADEALEILDGHLSAIAERLRDLTRAHRRQPQMGRTFLQDARPTTFGFRTATWLDAVLGHIVELRHLRGQLAVQLGGPVGTRDAYGEQDRAVVDALADRLGLGTSEVSWQTNRSRVLALAQAVERMARTMAKIGSDIALLASSPIAEVTVRSGGSSSMPEKMNPIDSVRTVAAAAACAGAAAMLIAAPSHELERAVGGWHVEWLALPLVFQTAGASVEAMEVCLGSLEVDAEVMGSSHPDSGASAAGSPQIDSVLSACDQTLAQRPQSPR